MDISVTPWLWLNWFLVALLLSAGWTFGCWLMGVLVGALRRERAP